MIDLGRGFLRLAIVVSLSAGVLSVFLSGRPTLDQFRTRQPTFEEKLKADRWWATRAQPQPSPEPSPKGAFDDLIRDLNDPLATAKLNDEESALRSIHLGERVQRDYQVVRPIAFFLRYYMLPFALGVTATWLVYAVIYFVVQGFRRQ